MLSDRPLLDLSRHELHVFGERGRASLLLLRPGLSRCRLARSVAGGVGPVRNTSDNEALGDPAEALAGALGSQLGNVGKRLAVRAPRRLGRRLALEVGRDRRGGLVLRVLDRARLLLEEEVAVAKGYQGRLDGPLGLLQEVNGPCRGPNVGLSDEARLASAGCGFWRVAQQLRSTRALVL